jgi:serine/threonine-protein kinase
MRLRTPHAIPVLDAGEHDGELWLEMPLLPGEDLAALLRRERRLDPHLALAVCGDVAEALDAAHALHLVHRDVKPANVRLVPDPLGGPPQAYLGDFGLTRSTAPGDPGLTGRFEIVGTSHYMSPEQATHQPVDGRTDVYSLACMLFHCLSGEPPFPGSDGDAVRNAHVGSPVPSLLGRGLPVGPQLAAAVQRGMAKRTEHRPATAGALLRDCRAGHRRDA